MIPYDKILEIRDKAHIEDVLEHEGITLSGKKNEWCCCPLHKEDTPSFHVNIARNYWKCFGCGKGGDAISFLMEYRNLTFYEAAEQLARDYNIDLPKNYEPSEAERQASLKRDAMRIALTHCHNYFIEQLQAHNDMAKEARRYAYKRWGEEFVKERGIGFAPDTFEGLKNYARQHSLSEQLLKEIGILKPRENKPGTYDQFRGRVVIPIFNHIGQLIGFTARILPKIQEEAEAKAAKAKEEGKEPSPIPPKYINSSNSAIYTKEDTVFGLDYGSRSARQDNRLYLCEGAADVLKLETLGINNAVACLGSSWTQKQLQLLKRYTLNLTFIPDSDPVKSNGHTPEEIYGTGVAKVMKYAVQALEMGFSVRVKEIGILNTKTGPQKQDADSFFTSLQLITDTPEEDFITWYALKLHRQFPNDDLKHIQSIAPLFCHLTSAEEVSYFKESLNKIFKSKTALNEAIAKAKHAEEERQAVARSNKKIDMKEWGFTEGHNYYYGYSGNGVSDWSNFILEPLFHIRDIISSARIYRITNKSGQSQIVEFKQEELGSVDKFSNKTESLGNYVWLAKMEQLKRLKLYLYETTETAFLIRQLGWQRQGFFAFGNGVVDNGQWIPVNNLGIVRLTDKGNFYLPAFSEIYLDDSQVYDFERRFIHTDYSTVSLFTFAKHVVEVFGTNGMVALSFYFATLFRDIIVAVTKYFPILNIFGIKGSGKSELGHTLMSFFIIQNIPPNIMNSTLPALSETVAQVSNALVHLDEYKNTLEIEKREFLKGLWDGAGRNRMNMDRDKKREVTKVNSGVILTGQEMCTADPALFSRVIFLRFEKDKFTDDEQARFNALDELRKLGCSHLTVELLKFRTVFEANFRIVFSKITKDFAEKFSDSIDRRVMGNWLVPLAAFRTLEPHIRLPFQYNQLERAVIDGILIQNENSRSTSELANFWDSFVFLYREGVIIADSDFKIKNLDFIRVKFRHDIVDRELDRPKDILFIRYAQIYFHYKQNCKKQGDIPLSKTTLLSYLQCSPAYLGSKASVRFKASIKGMPIPGDTVKEQSREIVKNKDDVVEAHCFDYTQLRDDYGVNLRTVNSDTPDPDDTPNNDGSPDKDDSSGKDGSPTTTTAPTSTPNTAAET